MIHSQLLGPSPVISDLPESVEPGKYRTRLLRNERLSENTHHLTFDVPPGFQYQSGQFLSFHHVVNGSKVTRAYSLAGPAGEPHFEICLKRVPGSISFCDLEPGADLIIEGPYGSFVPRISPQDSLFIATGTGIAPVRSIILDLLRRPERQKIHLLFGARAEDAILYRDQWESLEELHPGFSFFPTLSRPSEAWTGHRGRVQEHLAPFLMRTEMLVYICGSKAMVEDVRSRFERAGFDRSSIVYERLA